MMTKHKFRDDPGWDKSFPWNHEPNQTHQTEMCFQFFGRLGIAWSASSWVAGCFHCNNSEPSKAAPAWQPVYLKGESENNKTQNCRLCTQNKVTASHSHIMPCLKLHCARLCSSISSARGDQLQRQLSTGSITSGQLRMCRCDVKHLPNSCEFVA